MHLRSKILGPKNLRFEEDKRLTREEAKHWGSNTPLGTANLRFALPAEATCKPEARGGRAKAGGLGSSSRELLETAWALKNPLLESSWRLTEPSWRLLESLEGVLGSLGRCWDGSGGI